MLFRHTLSQMLPGHDMAITRASDDSLGGRTIDVGDVEVLLLLPRARAVEYPTDILGEELDQLFAEEEVAHEPREQHQCHHSLGKLRRHARDEIRLQTEEENEDVDGLRVTVPRRGHVVGDAIAAVHNVAAEQPVKNEEKGEAEVGGSTADAMQTLPRQSVAEEKTQNGQEEQHNVARIQENENAAIDVVRPKGFQGSLHRRQERLQLGRTGLRRRRHVYDDLRVQRRKTRRGAEALRQTFHRRHRLDWLMRDRVDIRERVHDGRFFSENHAVLHETLTHHRVDLRQRHDIGVHDGSGVGIHLLLLGGPVDQDEGDVLGLVNGEETYAVRHQLERFANRKRSRHKGNTRGYQIVLRHCVNVVPACDVVENTLRGDQFDGRLLANEEVVDTTTVIVSPLHLLVERNILQNVTHTRLRRN